MQDKDTKSGDFRVTASGERSVAAGSISTSNIYTGDVYHIYAPSQISVRPLPWHNLPRRNFSNFIGREEELDKLRQLMSPANRRHYTVTLDGIGGVGKSALALEFAHRHRERYSEIDPDERFKAIIWVSAKQTVLTARGIKHRQQTFSNLGDLYRAVATVLEEPLILRGDKNQQSRLAVHALTNQRTLLIIDNFETADDEELLSFLRDELPESTKVIITTRHRIDVAYPIRLTGMPTEDALALVGNEATQKGVVLQSESIESLLRRTGRVPLAIVWSIGLMSLGFEVSSVLRRLGSGHSDICRFCFDESVNCIRNRDAYRMLLTLSMFESSADRTMLGDVAGMGDDDEVGRDDALADLLQLSLVNKEESRFDLLPLTRTYALDELRRSGNLEQELTGRWIDCLTRIAKPYGAPRWLHRDRYRLRQDGAHLVTLAMWSQREERPDVLLAILPALREYYDLMGMWAERLSVSRVGLEYAELRGDQQSLVSVEVSLSWILSQQGNYAEAKHYISHALSVARQINNVIWQCEALIMYSVVLRRSSEFDQALDCCRQALELVPSLPEPQQAYARAWIDYEMGTNARDRGDWETAQNYLLAARAVFRHDEENPVFNLEFAWLVMNNLGFVEHQMGNLDVAERTYSQSLKFFREAGSKGDIATILMRLAILEEQRGNKATALTYAHEALDWSKRLGMPEAQKNLDDLIKRLNSTTH